ncbi:MAG TPA: hypothetical protein VFS09_09475, partial [Candidatus Eisenbacteria bacterium]|nr:hypothetical protein [Candidatus Eisenbacteria bacterium]
LYFLRQTLHMLFQAQRYFADEIDDAGGMLRVGLYAHNVQTNDFRRRIESLQRGLAKQQFLREQFPLDPSIEKELDEFRSQFQEVPFLDLQLRPHPFLHMKSQLFGTAEAFRILNLPAMGALLRSHLAIRQRQTQGIGRGALSPDQFHGFIRAFDAQLDSLSPGKSDRVILTFTTGSQNQNPRSMRLDGEVLVAVSGYDCAPTLVDFMFVLFISEWPATAVEFDRYFPPCRPPFQLRPLLGPLKDQS